MKLFSTIIIILAGSCLCAQPSIKVEVSADTIPVGEIVEVTYTIENGDGEFEAPDFGDLPVISGPNTSSSFVYQNGKMSSSQSYTYIFRPIEEGKMIIPEARYKSKNDSMKIAPVEVVVNKYGQRSKAKKSETEITPAKPAREKKKF